MGTTDNFDVPAKGSFAQGDKIPIIDAATGRGAYVLGSEVASGGAGASVNATAGATVLALTQAVHGNRAVTLNNTGPIAVTLPAASGSGTQYTVVLQTAATATQSTIKVGNTVDAMQGLVLSLNTTAGVLIGFKSTATDDTLTLNGTTTGGGVAAMYRFTDERSGWWLVEGRDTAAMTTTPYSASV